jgi:hypothetical protein
MIHKAIINVCQILVMELYDFFDKDLQFHMIKPLDLFLAIVKK